jgi:tetratricopeptide (TPR) repeat protein
MKTFLYLITTVWAIVAALLIPQVFINSTFIKNQLDKVLNLQIDPAFAGGRETGHFLDAVNDDYGEGKLTYPIHSMYTNGNGWLDIVKYTVHEPQTNARWSSDLDYWQVSFTFANSRNDLESILGFSHPVIHLYLDIDGKQGGRVDTAFSRSELVCFDSNHPWDFFITIDGFHKFGKIMSDDGTYEDHIKVFYNAEKRTTIARIPLVHPKLKQILDGRNTYHYVLIGAYDPLAQGGFMPVKAKAGSGYGGGAASVLSPRVYDYIPPQGKEQKQVLSAYNENDFTYAKIYPLEVTSKLYVEEQKQVDPEEIKGLEKQAEKEAQEKYAENMNIIENYSDGTGEKPIDAAVALFNINRFQKAEEILDKILKENPNQAIANSYKGAITSQKATAVASLAEKIKFVEQSISYLNKGRLLAQSQEEIITCSLCRAEVFMAIPEEVFARNKEAEQDLLVVIEILEKQEQKNYKFISDCYIKLAQCYLNQNRQDIAEIAFLKAQSQEELSAWARLELTKNGY